MLGSFYRYKTLHLLLAFLLLSSAYSLNFNITRFSPDSNITYEGDASYSVGNIEFHNVNYICRVGWATYAAPLRLWDSTGKLTDFTSHFSITFDTLNRSLHGQGMTFFLAPVGFRIPPNSPGGFLGLFNTTTSDSPQNQIVSVEFDSYVNPEWDPPHEHVGINNNSIASAVTTPWNTSLHSGDPADVWIIYNGTTKNLSVSWSYQRTSTSREKSSLSYQIDLMQILPEKVMLGFTGTTGIYTERHTLHFWEFNSTLAERESNGMGERKTIIIVAAAASVGVIIVAAAIALAILWRQKQKKMKRAKKMNSISIDDDLEKGAGPRRFSYRELVSATNNFSEDRKLGEGGFGAVYRGYLADLDVLVAVKKIMRGSNQGKKQYVTEVKVISSLRHRNLVQLIGWCHDGGEFLLVYEFMPNGSLDGHLFARKSHLAWAARYKIALGLGSAIRYLHEEWEQCVVHRDIKSSNVMLDSSFNVKLGDFGLARLMNHELGHQTTGLAGTYGYMAPEYIRTGKASKESDVYSFGVVALEIATGKTASGPAEENFQRGLVEWVWGLYGSGELLLAIDETLQQEFDEEQAECLMIVGLWCAHPDYNMRPSIKQALQVLHFDAPLPNLPIRMPVPTYHVPTPSVSSIEPSITHSLAVGR